MTTVAFLQNQWGGVSAEKAAEYEVKQRRMMEQSPEVYTRWIAMCLFAGCLTGRRITKAFSEEGVRAIRWANSSVRVATTPNGAFAGDPEHVAAILDHFKPDVVLCFGRVAEAAVESFSAERARLLLAGETIYRPRRILAAPHPAARVAGITTALAALAQAWRAETAQEAR